LANGTLPIYRLAALLSFLTLVAVAQTDERATVRMDATVPGTGRVAFGSALQRAQMAVVIDLLESATQSTDLTPFRPIIDRAPAYIRSYEVTAHEETDNATRVEIEVTVFHSQLREDMAKLLRPRLDKPPKALLLLVQQEGLEAPLALVEKGPMLDALGEALDKEKIQTVDYAEIRNRYEPEQLVGMLQEEGLARAAQMAREHLADVVIVGHLLLAASLPDSGGNVYKTQAAVTLRIAKAADGAVTGILSRDAVVHAVDPELGKQQALEDLVSKTGHELAVLSVLGAAGSAWAHGVLVEVLDLQDHEQLEHIRKALQEVWGVEEVRELVASDGLGRLSVSYSGPMGPLVDLLLATGDASFSLEMVRAVERSVTVVVQKR
jgi:hypothetical protein